MQRVTLGAMMACGLLMGCLEPAEPAPESHPCEISEHCVYDAVAGESVYRRLCLETPVTLATIRVWQTPARAMALRMGRPQETPLATRTAR